MTVGIFTHFKLRARFQAVKPRNQHHLGGDRDRMQQADLVNRRGEVTYLAEGTATLWDDDLVEGGCCGRWVTSGDGTSARLGFGVPIALS